VGPFDPRRKTPLFLIVKRANHPNVCAGQPMQTIVFVVSQATFAGVSMIDTHILGWFVKQVKQVIKGLFSECVDSQFVPTSDRPHEFPLPRGGHR
jgi:hypothetical protein